MSCVQVSSLLWSVQSAIGPFSVASVPREVKDPVWGNCGMIKPVSGLDVKSPYRCSMAIAAAKTDGVRAKFPFGWILCLMLYKTA